MKTIAECKICEEYTNVYGLTLDDKTERAMWICEECIEWLEDYLLALKEEV